MARKIGLIAEVLSGAKKEHLHARLPTLFFNGNDIGFGYIARVDAAILLHISQGANAVARGGSGFKIRRFAGRLHFFQQRILHLSAFAVQKIARFSTSSA